MQKMIYHIAKKSEWDNALIHGSYTADSLHQQGFIHCSKLEQVIAVANLLFHGQAGLVLLCVQPEKVTSEIRYENLEGGLELFPHIYGPINLEAVEKIVDFDPKPSGHFSLPPTLGNE
jgi:uncharacterized protein (DUF952 family)